MRISLIFSLLLTLVTAGNYIFSDSPRAPAAPPPPPRYLSSALKFFRNLNIYFSSIKELDKNNQGAMSIVFSAIMTNENLASSAPTKVLIKVSKKLFTKDLENECEILKEILHFKRDDIVKVYDCYSDLKRNIHVAVMEFIEGKDMYEYCETKPKDSIETAKNILKSIASTIKFLHSIGISHRDIKVENVMMRKVGQKFSPVLIDFGCASNKETDIKGKGTWAIFGPEYLTIFSRLEYRKPINLAQADVFALGVLFYEFLSWRRLDVKELSASALNNYYRQFSHNVINTEILMNRISEDYSIDDADAASGLIYGMISGDPIARLTIGEVLNHRFFKCEANYGRDTKIF